MYLCVNLSVSPARPSLPGPAREQSCTPVLRHDIAGHLRYPTSPANSSYHRPICRVRVRSVTSPTPKAIALPVALTVLPWACRMMIVWHAPWLHSDVSLIELIRCLHGVCFMTAVARCLLYDCPTCDTGQILRRQRLKNTGKQTAICQLNVPPSVRNMYANLCAFSPLCCAFFVRVCLYAVLRVSLSELCVSLVCQPQCVGSWGGAVRDPPPVLSSYCPVPLCAACRLNGRFRL